MGDVSPRKQEVQLEQNCRAERSLSKSRSRRGQFHLLSPLSSPVMHNSIFRKSARTRNVYSARQWVSASQKALRTAETRTGVDPTTRI